MASKRKRQKSLLNYLVPKTEATPATTTTEEEEKTNNESEEAIVANLEQEDNEFIDTEPTVNKNTPPPPVIFDSDSQEEEDEVVVIPRKRKLIKKRIIEEEESENDSAAEQDINLKQTEQCDSRIINDEELNFLDKSDILQDRTRGKQVSRYTEALKKLADRKSKLDSYKGEKGPIEKYSTILVSSSEEEEEEEEVEEEEEEEEQGEQDDSELEGFVVDDDIIDGEKKDSSEEMLEEMPAEFTTARTRSFSKQLSIYIEYLIVLSLNPVFDISTNSKYRIAKNAVTRRVSSYKDSMVTSDVWLPSFKAAVDKYSNWIFLDSTNDGAGFISFMTCQACRTNKPASYKIRLTNDTENEAEQETFYIGSECCRKGEIYHQFNHFELHMYNKVKNQVEEVMMKQQKNKQEIIHESLIQSGYIKKVFWFVLLAKHVKSLFNIVIKLYNLKSQRFVNNDSSSSSSSSSEEEE